MLLLTHSYNIKSHLFSSKTLQKLNFQTMKTNIIYFALMSQIILSCAVIRPGEVGIKQKLGKFSNEVIKEGSVLYNPILSKVVKESTQTQNIKLILSLPSKEGLSVQSEISILYRLEEDKVASVLENLGQNYESIVTSVFRSAASDVCAQFFAKDMHSGVRSKIEGEILSKMKVNLEKQANGVDLIAVLMKQIQLPRGLANSIERKLQAEQDAMRMDFVLNQERKEAERKIISAKGERDAQIIISEGLTEGVLRNKAIEAFKQLSSSKNSKVIITDGNTPLMINNEIERK